MSKTTPGTVRLDTLHQGEYWVDRSGQEHIISDMGTDHLGNLLGYLERNAERFQELQRECDYLDMALYGFDDPDFAPWWYPSPELWIEQTKLFKAIKRELENRS